MGAGVVAAGRFALTDRSFGEQVFNVVVEVLEKAVGPEGVLLGTLVRLPIHPTDRRGFLERCRDRRATLSRTAVDRAARIGNREAAR